MVENSKRWTMESFIWCVKTWRGERRQEKLDIETEKEEETMKKERLFNKKWKSGREWLVYYQGAKVIYCNNWRTYNGEKMKRLSFVAGISNFKVKTIKPWNVWSYPKHCNKKGRHSWFARRQCGGEVYYEVGLAWEDAGAVLQCTRYKEEM